MLTKEQVATLTRAMAQAQQIQRIAMTRDDWRAVVELQDKIAQVAELLGCSPYAGEV